MLGEIDGIDVLLQQLAVSRFSIYIKKKTSAFMRKRLGLGCSVANQASNKMSLIPRCS